FLAVVLVGVFLLRGHAEGFCPFGGVEGLYTWLRDGAMPCSLGMSNFYILGALLAVTLVVRRAFCGFACPIGTISEWLRRGAARLGLPGPRVPERLDRALRLLKYPLLAVILWLTWRAGELVFRGFDPCYALIGRHGEDITFWAYVVSGGIVVGSLFVMMPFCRWLCPLAAVFHPFSRFGYARIRRDAGACVDCGRCAEACPTAIPVDREGEVRAARCIACLECIDACPVPEGRALSWGPPGPSRRRWSPAVLIAVLLAGVGAAVTATYAFPAPSYASERGERPPVTATLDLEVGDLTCRGRATLFTYFLERDDFLAISGYLRVEAWPAPGGGRARIAFDPSVARPEDVRRAITEPFFDAQLGLWQHSPFELAEN
ncbi:MAG: 4Fe-4S binding protein, partial [Candidatus Eisenbacteria bacterium]|nr:4Fe-4S binding protein [Candidatus Eisenbacteria bacterium]